MVVLDALHWIQGHEAPDLAVRWNCKAAKCGSCSAEVDGRPRLTCKTRLSDFDLDEPITVEPMRAFPLIRDLVTDVSWNYEVNKTIQPFTPPADIPQEDWRWQQAGHRAGPGIPQVHRVLPVPGRLPRAAQPRDRASRSWARATSSGRPGLEMHPIDQADRREYLKDSGGIGYCNITKCCTEVCPEHIKITDNAIIPLKERVADEYYDPLQWAWRKLRGGDQAVGRAGRAARPPGHAGPRRADRAESPGLSDTLFPELAAGARRRADDGAEDRGTRGFVIRTDGAARGNPGPASPGAALFDLTRPDARDAAPPDASISDFLGVQTNNVAEYTGRRPRPRAGPRARRARGRPPARLEAHRRAARRPLAGQGRQAHPAWAAARRTLAGFDRWSAAHVPRAQNTVADALANEAIDRAPAGGPASSCAGPAA